MPFCPEDHRLGTPRTMPDLHGGDGHDVLDGTARVRDEHGADLTEALLAGADSALAWPVDLGLLGEVLRRKPAVRPA